MDKVHTLFRVTQGGLGGGILHPVKTFKEQSDAEDACRKSVAAFAEIIEGTVLVKTAAGPRAVMTIKQFLTELGISTLSHNVLTQETHGALILTPTASMIIQ